MKKDPQPRFIHMKNLNGEFVAPKDRAEAIATYLQDKHWTSRTNVPVENSAIIQDLTDQFDTGHFTMAEFDAALAKNKMYKQPGPDKIVMELFKWMNNENISWLLRLINFWWDNKVAPNDPGRTDI